MRAYQIVLTIAALLPAMPALAQRATTPATIWHDLGDATALDLVGGPGGTAREPGVEFRFIKESEGGASPKFEVEDYAAMFPWAATSSRSCFARGSR